MAQIGFAPGSDVAFGMVFGLFVLAFLVLAFVAIRWGVRRDRPGRQAWRQRRVEGSVGRNAAAPLGSDDRGVHNRAENP